MDKKEATNESGRALAEQWKKRLAEAQGDERRQELERLIAELEADPRKIDLLIGYGERLREESQRSEKH